MRYLNTITAIWTALEAAYADFVLDGMEGPPLPTPALMKQEVDCFAVHLANLGYRLSGEVPEPRAMDSDAVRAAFSVRPGLTVLYDTREATTALADALLDEGFTTKRWCLHDANTLRRLMVSYVLTAGVRPTEPGVPVEW